MRKLLFSLLLLTAPAFGQSYFLYQNCQLQTAQGQAVAGASVYFLTQPANTSTLTPLATVYANSTGAGGPVTQPLKTDSHGQCWAYTAAGVYTVVYQSPYTGKLIHPDQTIANPIGGGGGTPPGGGPQAAQFNNGGVFGGSLATLDATGNIVTPAAITAQAVTSTNINATNLFGTNIRGNIVGGFRYAAQYQTGGGNNGIANALATNAQVIADPSYANVEAQPFGGSYSFFYGQTTGPKASDPQAGFTDYRNGVPQWVFNGSQTPAGDNRHTIWPSLTMNYAGTPPLQGTYANVAGNLLMTNNFWTGGRNFYNDKVNLSSMVTIENHYAQVQGGGSINHTVFCYGNGDCANNAGDTVSWGGPNTAGDEGNEGSRHEEIEGGTVYNQAIAGTTIAADGTTTILPNLFSQWRAGTQGEGRLLINLDNKYNTGYIANIYPSGGNELVHCAGGCDWDGTYGTSHQTTLTAVVENPVNGLNSFPQTNTVLHVADSTGFTPGNLACVFDYDYECEIIDSVGTGTVTLKTDQLPHPVGSYVTTGGLAGAAIEFEADRVSPNNTNGVYPMPDSPLWDTVRWAIPIMYSETGNNLYFFQGYNSLPGASTGYTGRAYGAMGGSGDTCSVTVSGGHIDTATAAGSGSGYTGPPTIVLTGTWTTGPVLTTGSWGNTGVGNINITYAGTGIVGTPTCAVVTSNPYDIYPAAKTLKVYNSASGQIDGTFVTEPWSIATPTYGQVVEQPHYFLMNIKGDTNHVIGQYIPTIGIAAKTGLGYIMTGIWGLNDRFIDVTYASSPLLYQGYPAGRNQLGLGQLIAEEYETINGPFRSYFDMNSPPIGPVGYKPSLFHVGCGSLTCDQWYTPYYLFSMEGATQANGFLYTPSTDTVTSKIKRFDLSQSFLNLGVPSITAQGGLVSQLGQNWNPYSDDLSAGSWTCSPGASVVLDGAVADPHGGALPVWKMTLGTNTQCYDTTSTPFTVGHSVASNSWVQTATTGTVLCLNTAGVGACENLALNQWSHIYSTGPAAPTQLSFGTSFFNPVGAPPTVIWVFNPVSEMDKLVSDSALINRTASSITVDQAINQAQEGFETTTLKITDGAGTNECLQRDTLGNVSGTGTPCGSGGGGGGASNVTVNGGSILAAANFSDTTPAAGANGKNILFQNTGTADISGELVGDGNPAHFLDGTGNYSSPPGAPQVSGWYDMITQGGIDNTGATDVGAAIISIINGLDNTNPVTLYFGPGTYKINNGILISATPTTKSGIRFVGAGRDSTIFATTCANGYGIWYNNATGTGDNFSGMQFEQFQIHGTGGANCQDGLRLTQTSLNTVNSVKISGFTGATYAAGTVGISGSTVTGSGTSWTAAMVPGVMQLAGVMAEVCTYNSSTSLSLCDTAWPTGTQSAGKSYALAYGGRGLTFDPGNSYTQYITVKDYFSSNNLFGIYSMGVSSGGNSRIKIDGKAGWIGWSGSRLANSIGIFLGKHSDTFEIHTPVNNTARCFVVDSGHANDFAASDCENNTTETVVTTCNGGVAAQSCLAGFEITADAASTGYGNSITDPYVYHTGTAFQVDNTTGATNLTITGLRGASFANTNSYSFNGSTGCPNITGVNILNWDCNTGTSGTTTAFTLTANNSGTGDASGMTFDGSSAKTISYNTLGASPLAGSASLVAAGTLTSGTWHATAIAPQYGGTGQNWNGSSGIPQFNAGTASLFNTSCTGASNALTFSGGALSCNSAIAASTATSATTAANLSGTPALPNGTTATTQTTGDNTTKIATDAFVIANISAGSVTKNGNLTTKQMIIGGTNGTTDITADSGCSTDGAGALSCLSYGTSGSTNGALTLTSNASLPAAESANQLLLTVPNSLTHYTIILPGSQPTPGNTFLSCTNANPSICSWAAAGAGAGTVTVVGAGSLTSTAIVTGGGTTTLQTPSATSTLDASGNMVLAGTLTATGYSSTGTGAGFLNLTAGTAPSAPGTSVIQLAAPTSATAYTRTFANAAPGTTSVPSYSTAGVESWKGLGGAGAAVVTGPSSGTTAAHIASYSDTAGTIQDSGVLLVSNIQITVGTGAVAANTCATVATAAMSGLTTGMTLSLTPTTDVSLVVGWSAASTGQLYFTAWPTANTLNYKVCNPTGTSITPGSSTTWNVSAR